MVKKLIKIVSVVWIIVMTLAIGISYYYNSSVKNPLKNLKAPVTIEIKVGDNISTIISRVDSKADISNSFIVKYYAKSHSQNIKINAGYLFVVQPGMTTRDILNAIANAVPKDPNAVKVTIVEGTTIDDIAKVLETKGIISSKDFIDAVKKYKLPAYVKSDSKRRYALEGFLYPDTYYMDKNSKGNDVIKILLGNFEKKLQDAQKETGIVLGDDEVDKIVTLASMIESEVKAPNERPIVSSVFTNRLKLGMTMGSDATIQYALGVHKEQLTEADTKINSPYNTYVVAGLPEGPICNPRKESIEAAMNPAQTKYLFFFAKKDGTHVFSETYEQHLAAASKYGK
ncbi:MAG: endolytic transglycosylase MltG [Bacillota bacterium]|nr:endolytic transglycosylase MltG [Bacillota bacterium]